jgi:hypothetical protein
MTCATLVPLRFGVNRGSGSPASGVTCSSVAAINGTVSLRVLGAAPAAAVAEPVLLALGARAGLDVAVLDELVMAVELAIRGAGRPLLIEVTPDEGRLTVAVRPLEPEGLRECGEAVRRLVTDVEIDRDGAGIVMRAG